MAYKRYVVEFGSGADLHGADVTKAAKKAVKDAVSHCCLCGLKEILELENMAAAMKVQVKIGTPKPEEIDKEAVLEMVPFGKREIEVVAGGISAKGLHVPTLGAGDDLVIVNAVLTVWIDLP